MFKSVLIIFILLQLTQCWGARILTIFPMHSYSHHILGEAIVKELASQGHEITFISTYEAKEVVPNIKNIHLKEAADSMKDRRLGFNSIAMPKAFIAAMIHELTLKMSRIVFENKDVQNLLKSDEEFDLIFLEHFFNEPLFAFTHRFKAPIVLLAASGSCIYNNRIVGNPAPPSYVPHILLDYTAPMSFWQRFKNFFFIAFNDFVFYVLYMPRFNNLVHEFFPDAPYLQELVDNTSLILLNSHPAVNPPVPLVPNMIEIGGFHITPHQNISEDLKSFLDQAEEGVIYFSMGSNLRSDEMPSEVLEELLTVFASLKMKVLWKFENDKLPGKPDNVRIEKWIPQPAVLAHPNTKLFLTHGGRLSTLEAIYFGVPIIGIPIFADQHTNMAYAEAANYGISVGYHGLTSEILTDAIKTILTNPRYIEEVKLRSSSMRSGKFTALESAVHWIEYVLKLKGAHHLRNASLSLSWYQYLLLDVILVSLICCVIIGKLFYVIVRSLYRWRKNGQKLKRN